MTTQSIAPTLVSEALIATFRAQIASCPNQALSTVETVATYVVSIIHELAPKNALPSHNLPSFGKPKTTQSVLQQSEVHLGA